LFVSDTPTIVHAIPTQNYIRIPTRFLRRQSNYMRQILFFA
jgi:hypothetical protein